MNGYLVDTNVISELRKGDRANANVRDRFAGVEDKKVFLSVLVVGEIRRGVESIRKRDLKAATSLDRWLAGIVKAHSRRILPVDTAIAEVWGQLDAAGQVPVVDGLLAATAPVHDLTLVTRNVKGVARTKLAVLNPFEVAS